VRKFETSADLRTALRTARTEKARIGLVPTMGALHEGHLSLVKLSKQMADITVMTIFVNPLQFNNAQDLEKYPRTVEKDAAMAAEAGVDLLFAPQVGEIYPESQGQQTSRITAGSLANTLEGPMRPGHFDGVTTVVGLLFNIVQPDIAVFGLKDFQQLRVIQQMVRDLHFGVEIIAAPIVRCADGLAMSSRNERLSAAARAAAITIPQALLATDAAARAGEHSAQKLIAITSNFLSRSASLEIEYVKLVDPLTLEELTSVNDSAEKKAQLLVAVWCGGVRLIDNMLLQRSESNGLI